MLKKKASCDKIILIEEIIMKRKLGLLADCITTQEPWKTLRLMKEVGFETFFTLYYDDDTLENLRNTANELDMEFEFIQNYIKNLSNLFFQKSSK